MERGNSDGVFQYLIDRAAFLDRVELSIWGTRRRRAIKHVSLMPTFAIGGPKSFYARAANGFCRATGNTFQLRYGVMRWFRRVPPYRLILYSNATPLSYAQVELIVKALVRGGFRAQVSKIELTFDLSETSVGFFIRHAQTRARRTRRLRDEFGRRTFYVGGARSQWQLRVYDKADLVTRFEFIFRRAFLRRIGIRYPHELVFLRRANLRRLVWLWEVDRSQLPRAVQASAGSLTVRQLWAATKDYGPARSEWFRPCPIEKQLQRMQGRLVW